ncbi:non-reducing end alpha-L-arabinofuranosidase family hydrolase, partial [Streptomyces odontomachi]|uniref:non-reducing end alpha-L-arabinofuranosidase family hydrolase n=1 Tax=Streptomyces odontomachi TaxID=2944940 RepID=UPI00210E196D
MRTGSFSRTRLSVTLAAGGAALVALAATLVANPAQAATTTPSAAAACSLPSTYKWSSTGVLAQPANGWVSLKDFS